MVVAVIGLGSMGKRRIRLIQEMYPHYSIFGIDEREDRRKEAKNLLNIQCFSSMEEAVIAQNINCVFVCTSPLSHNTIITKCLNYKWNVFTELNLVSDGYEENIRLAHKNGCILFLSSTFFYREEISYIRNKVTQTSKWNYIYHIGQYLPDWHPWESYKDFFVGDKRTNGCREIMAIELPWLISTFGEVCEYHVVSGKMTSLDIEFDDNYFIQFIHQTGNKGVLIVDVVSPYAVRKLEVYGEQKYIFWEGTPESLKEYNPATDSLEKVSLNEEEEHREEYRAFVVENAYKNEIKEFFEVVLGKKEPLYGFEQDLKVLHLINFLEKSHE